MLTEKIVDLIKHPEKIPSKINGKVTQIKKSLPYAMYVPETIHLDITNECNLRCLMCPQSVYHKTVRGFMDFDLYKQVIDECAKLKIKSVHVFNFGESLLHPKFVECVQYAKQKGIEETILYSNGTLMDDEMATKVLKSGLDKLVFSLDSVNKEQFEKFRRTPFEVVAKNVHGTIKLKKKLGLEKPFIVCQEIYNYGKKDLIGQNSPEYWDFFKDNMPDRIIGRPFYNLGGSITEKRSNVLNMKIKSGHQLRPCPLIWKRFTVQWDGQCIACCRDFRGVLKIGDLTKGDTIMSAWNGKEMRKLRSEHLKLEFEKNPICRNCDMIVKSNVEDSVN